MKTTLKQQDKYVASAWPVAVVTRGKHLVELSASGDGSTTICKTLPDQRRRPSGHHHSENVNNNEAPHTTADTSTRINVDRPNYTVSGTVTLQGCVPAAVSAQPITFEFRPAGGGASFTRTLNLNSDGTFSLPGVPAAAYNLAIKGTKWLRKVVAVDASTGNVTGVTATLLAGDVNNDNIVSTSDYLQLKAAFGSHPGDFNWDPAADLNCDGTVSTADYILLKGNMGLQGDP